MSNVAHFFDLDVLINLNSTIWIVSKTKPSIPVIKITQSEFNLIKKGIYRKYNSPLEINSEVYWLPENLLSDLKVKCKNMKYDITDLAFSMQEFTNSTVIDKLDYDIMLNHFQHLKNTNDDIYVICSKNSKRNYDSIIKKLESEFLKLGLKINNYYYLSETFYNRDVDYIIHKKNRLLLQHLFGLKTDGDKFTNEKITKYDRVNFYDDEIKVIEMVKDSNNLFQALLSKSDDGVKSIVKDIIKSNDNIIVVNQITHNKVNPFVTKEVLIEWSYLTKTFEGFISNLFKKSSKKELVKYTNFDLDDLKYLFIDLEDINFDVKMVKSDRDFYQVKISEGGGLKSSTDANGEFLKHKNKIINTISSAISYVESEYGLNTFITQIDYQFYRSEEETPMYKRVLEIDDISKIDWNIPNITIEFIKK